MKGRYDMFLRRRVTDLAPDEPEAKLVPSWDELCAASDFLDTGSFTKNVNRLASDVAELFEVDSSRDSSGLGSLLLALGILAAARLRHYEGVAVSCGQLARHSIDDDRLRRRHVVVVRTPPQRTGDVRFRLTAREGEDWSRWEVEMWARTVLEVKRVG